MARYLDGRLQDAAPLATYGAVACVALRCGNEGLRGEALPKEQSTPHLRQRRLGELLDPCEASVPGEKAQKHPNNFSRFQSVRPFQTYCADHCALYLHQADSVAKYVRHKKL